MEAFKVETNRLILRPFQASDAEDYFRITRNKAIKKYVPYACPKTLHDCTHDINEVYSKGDFEHDYYVIIEEKKSHRIVGAIICVQIEDFDTSYFIAKRYRERGYMQEALQGFIGAMPVGGALLFKVELSNLRSIFLLENIPHMENVSDEYGPYDGEHAYFKLIL